MHKQAVEARGVTQDSSPHSEAAAKAGRRRCAASRLSSEEVLCLDLPSCLLHGSLSRQTLSLRSVHLLA